jgi:ankyrin repeat protein
MLCYHPDMVRVGAGVLVCGCLCSVAWSQDEGHATVKTDSLTVYSQMSSTSDVVRTLVTGDAVTVSYSIASEGGEWCSVSPGYVLCRSLDRQKLPPAVTAPDPKTAPVVPAPIAPAVEHPVAPPKPLTPEQAALVSILIAAAKSGNLTAIQLAMEKGAEINGADIDGKTPLMWAAYTGQYSAVTALLAAGADMQARDKMGWTALHAAAWARRAPVVSLLLENGAAADAKDLDDRTALMHAAQYGETAMVKDLIAKGANTNARNKFDQTPLMFAVTLRDTSTAEALLEGGADINAKDAAGRTVLMDAVLAGADRAPAVEWLLVNGAETNAADKQGRSALKLAAEHGYPEMVTLLRKAHAR